MPLTVPQLDDRTYQQLLDEALRRVPVHNPEWTSFNEADPGVTLIELFAFLTENLLYRANQVPERNRRKFLSLLGVPLQPATSARGIVTFSNERGPQRTITLGEGMEVRAGQVPFRTTAALDVLPIEARVYYKRRVVAETEPVRAYYEQLYASYLDPAATDGAARADRLTLYATTPLDAAVGTADGVDVSADAVDGALWVALLLRRGDRPGEADNVRREIAGKTLSLGIVPWVAEEEGGGRGRRLPPGGAVEAASGPLLHFMLPSLPPDGRVPLVGRMRRPSYRELSARTTVDLLVEPGVAEVLLPADPAELRLWSDVDPLEAGVGDLPPTLEDSATGDRVITWLRVQAPGAARLRLQWAGVNAVLVDQRAQVNSERLPDGTGEPDQAVTLANRPLITRSVRLFVTADGQTEEWREVDDLLAAGPEVPAPDPRRHPGVRQSVPPASEAKVFAVDPEAGLLRFGDGTRGARPPRGALLRADYAFGAGRAGNVGAGAIAASPALPAGIKVANPVRTWGGADAESVREGERQIVRYLQHRDRMVSAADFKTITLRTPGVEIGRVDVLPAFHPDLPGGEPGDAPGAVTLLIVPRNDPRRPDWPEPDRQSLDAVCAYLDPRRLITTELLLRGPAYRDIWVSVGFEAQAGLAVPQVREAIRRAIGEFLSPLPDPSLDLLDEAAPPELRRGWPLWKAVLERELLAVVSRVPGVLLVTGVLLAGPDGGQVDQVAMRGLQLPRLAGLSVVAGEPLPLAQLTGRAGPDGGAGDGGGPLPFPTGESVVPVPVIPEECR